jgi:hypothetical protein
LIRRVRQSAKSDLDRQANAMLSRMRDAIGGWLMPRASCHLAR